LGGERDWEYPCPYQKRRRISKAEGAGRRVLFSLHAVEKNTAGGRAPGAVSYDPQSPIWEDEDGRKGGGGRGNLAPGRPPEWEGLPSLTEKVKRGAGMARLGKKKQHDPEEMWHKRPRRALLRLKKIRAIIKGGKRAQIKRSS